MDNLPLLLLPPELLNEVLLRLDPPSLCAISETCRSLRDAVNSPNLWHAYLSRRFRIHVLRFRGTVTRTPKDIYVQWHRQQRMPLSKHTNQHTPVFARGVETIVSPLRKQVDIGQCDSAQQACSLPTCSLTTPIAILDEPNLQLDQQQRQYQRCVCQNLNQNYHPTAWQSPYQIEEMHCPEPCVFQASLRCPCTENCVSTGNHGPCKLPLSVRDNLCNNFNYQKTKEIDRFTRRRQNGGGGVLAWVTVPSTDDCRVDPAGLQLRFVIQNIGVHSAWLSPAQVSLLLTTGERLAVANKPNPGHRSQPAFQDLHVIPSPVRAKSHHQQFMPQCRPNRRSLNRGNLSHLTNQSISCNDCEAISRERDSPSDCELSVIEHSILIDRTTFSSSRVAYSKRRSHSLAVDAAQPMPVVIQLEKDDFCIISLRLKLPDVVHEVDALERLDLLSIPLRRLDSRGLPQTKNCHPDQSKPHSLHADCHSCVHAKFINNTIWQNYEQMPGGWWARRDLSHTAVSSNDCFITTSTA